jgi:hypothetical protein
MACLHGGAGAAGGAGGGGGKGGVFKWVASRRARRLNRKTSRLILVNAAGATKPKGEIMSLSILKDSERFTKLVAIPKGACVVHPERKDVVGEKSCGGCWASCFTVFPIGLLKCLVEQSRSQSRPRLVQ